MRKQKRKRDELNATTKEAIGTNSRREIPQKGGSAREGGGGIRGREGGDETIRGLGQGGGARGKEGGDERTRGLAQSRGLNEDKLNYGLGGGGGSGEGGAGGGEGRDYSDIVRKGKVVSERPVTVEVIQYKSNWALEMSQVSLDRQLRIANEAAARDVDCGEVNHFSKKKNATKPILLGDSMDRHDPSDWPWEMSETEWDGTQDRVERNREKKKRNIENRKLRIEKAARIGQCTLGLGPIKSKSLDYFLPYYWRL